MNKMLIFDVSGDYAHFKKYFTNMTPTTFIIPPRTVIAGIIGAILGHSKDSNPEMFNKSNSLISVNLLKPVTKVIMQINSIKGSSIGHITCAVGVKRQVNYEFVKQPKYRIYFSHADKTIYDKMKSYLEHHLSTYSICLGVAQCLANYEYIGEYSYEKRENNSFVKLASVLPIDNLLEINFEANNRIQKSVLPNYMLNNREVTCYKEFLFSAIGEPLDVKVKHYYEINILGDKICVM